MKGVKGACVVFMHPLFDVVKGVVIDELHCVFLGVVTILLEFWFHTQYSHMDYNIRPKVTICNNEMAMCEVVMYECFHLLTYV